MDFKMEYIQDSWIVWHFADNSKIIIDAKTNTSRKANILKNKFNKADSTLSNKIVNYNVSSAYDLIYWYGDHHTITNADAFEL